MVTLALTNQNPHSQHRQVKINIVTGLCTFADDQKIELKRLMSELDFSHPLLMEPFTHAPDYMYHHEYHNTDGLLHSAIYVYSTLLRVDKPLACKFKINPSSAFQYSTFAKNIYFSIHRHKPAKESIHISQLEALVSYLGGYQFKFSEDIIIDDTFTIADLPSLVNGDALYKSQENIAQLLDIPRDFSCYELRYIDCDMGFGVFSREVIKQGDIVSLYSGIKSTNKQTTLDYAYKSKLDSLNMCLDARPYGNIARFINHAPEPDVNQPASLLLEANVKTKSYYLNGIETVVYLASKDIQKGEQLLVDYGSLFFQGMLASRFKINGQVIDSNKKTIHKKSQKKLQRIRIMARHDIKEAQRYLYLRLLVIAGGLLVLMGMLNYV